VFNSSGTAVSTNVWSGQNFTGGQSQQYTYTWNVPSTQATGTYTVMIGVFDSTWATNYYWNSNGATITVTTGQTAPVAPTGLTATAGSGQVALSWTASSGAASYNVYRGTAAGAESATPIATGITATAYTNTGLTNGTTYYYKVAAVNPAGTSPMSNEASAKPVSAAINVTASLQIISTAFVYTKSTKRYSTTVTLLNQSSQAISGPLQFVVTNLPSGVTLYSPTGTYSGSPYVTIPGASLAAGASTTVKLEFKASSAAQIAYTPVVYSGTF
jgi:hypothetical protein